MSETGQVPWTTGGTEKIDVSLCFTPAPPSHFFTFSLPFPSIFIMTHISTYAHPLTLTDHCKGLYCICSYNVYFFTDRLMFVSRKSLLVQSQAGMLIILVVVQWCNHPLAWKFKFLNWGNMCSFLQIDFELKHTTREYKGVDK